jgi:2-methylcitrate dehydratase PrpD
MTNAIKETLLQEIADWVSAVKFEQIPPSALEKAKLQILSVLAAIHSSAKTRAGKILLMTAKNFYGDGNVPLLPTGEKVSLSASVFASAGLSVAQDYDDYLLFGHTGHSAVSVPLLLGQFLKASPREILTAQVIINEISGRIGASVLLGPHNGQTWSHIHLIGSAAGSARLLGLSADKIAQAMAISLYQPTYVLAPGFMGPDSKLLTSAVPATIGLQSAFLAEKGFTGALDILENKQGFLKHFSYYPLPMMLSGFGKAWVTETLAYKIYPGCAYIDTTVDAMFAILDKYKKNTGKELDAEDITEIIVEATALTVEMDRLSKVGISFDPLNPVSVNFSIPGNLALVLLKRKLTGEDLTEENLQANADKIKLLGGRVKLKHNLELTVDMLRKMNPVLKINELFRTLRLRGLAQAQRRINQQYGRRMGLEFEPLLEFLRKNAWLTLKTAVQGARFRMGKLVAGKAGEGKAWSLADADLENFTMPFSAIVSVKLKNGEMLTHRQDIPYGGPGEPLEERKKLMLNKFMVETRDALSEKEARDVAEKILRFEEFNSCEEILGGICGK